MVNSPITTTNVANELGVSTHNVRELCTSTNINKFAKYKPVPLNSLTPNRSGTWWKGDDGLCGLSIPHAAGSPDDIYNAEWGYNPPKGGSSSPYRLADFMGYNQNCTFPITGWLKNQVIEIDKQSPTVRIQCAVLSPTATNNLQIADCDLLSNFRLGVKITAGTKDAWIQTSENRAIDVVADSGILQVAIDFSKFDYLGTSQFTVTQFFTTDSYTTMATFPTVITCYSVPNYYGSQYTNRITVKYTSVTPGLEILAEGLSNQLSGTYYDESHYVNNPYNASGYIYEYWKLKVTNNDNLSKTLNVTQLTYHGPTTSGGSVTDDYDHDMMMYDSNKSQAYSVTIARGETKYIYMRTRLFSQAFVGSATSLCGIWHAYYTNRDDGIYNRYCARFETCIKK